MGPNMTENLRTEKCTGVAFTQKLMEPEMKENFNKVNLLLDEILLLNKMVYLFLRIN